MKVIAGRKFYLMPDLIDELRISRVSIQKYIRDGRLKGVKIAEKWHVSEEDLQNFLSGSTSSANSPGSAKGDIHE